jgi:predicted NBD/HSP70 family sugar kinase
MSVGRIDITLKIRHRQRMRTTLSLDDEVLRLVKHYAESRSLGLGKAVSELVRRGLTAQRPTRTVNGLRVFNLPADFPPVTRKKIEEIDSDDE